MNFSITGATQERYSVVLMKLRELRCCANLFAGTSLGQAERFSDVLIRARFPARIIIAVRVSHQDTASY